MWNMILIFLQENSALVEHYPAS